MAYFAIVPNAHTIYCKAPDVLASFYSLQDEIRTALLPSFLFVSLADPCAV